MCVNENSINSRVSIANVGLINSSVDCLYVASNSVFIRDKSNVKSGHFKQNVIACKHILSKHPIKLHTEYCSYIPVGWRESISRGFSSSYHSSSGCYAQGFRVQHCLLTILESDEVDFDIVAPSSRRTYFRNVDFADCSRRDLLEVFYHNLGINLTDKLATHILPFYSNQSTQSLAINFTFCLLTCSLNKFNLFNKRKLILI